MLSPYARRALRLSVQITVVAAVGEAAFEALCWLSGSRPTPLFLYAALAAGCLPIVVVDRFAEHASFLARLALSIVLLGVVSLNAVAVAIANGGKWNIGGLPLAVLPLWFVGCLLCLATGDLMRLKRIRERNRG